jgi:hypothetical protein
MMSCSATRSSGHRDWLKVQRPQDRGSVLAPRIQDRPTLSVPHAVPQFRQCLNDIVRAWLRRFLKFLPI